jgi:hypothetical protein
MVLRVVNFGGRFIAGGRFFVFLLAFLSLLAKVQVSPLFYLFLDLRP